MPQNLINDWLDRLNTINYDEIPDIDLYMDQLTTILEEKLSGYKRERGEKILTKTMINNYTKDAVLPPPERKKYNKEQIALLIIIYHLKPAATLSDISLIFDAVEAKKLGVPNFYKLFEEILSRETAALSDEIAERLANNDIKGDENTMLAVSLIVSASLRKHMAEKIIDNLIPKL